MLRASVLLVLALAFAGTTAARRVDPHSLELSFEDWQIVHGKQYADHLSEALAQKKFISNRNLLHQLQRELENDGVKLALTHFADMDPEEFAARILMPRRPAPAMPAGKELYVPAHVQVQDLPESFDWREKGAVTPVADQGTVGTCWVFSTVGNIESQWFLANNTLVELSKEQVVECDADEDVKNGHADCGVFGGWPYVTMGYVINQGGLMTEKDYPYCVGSGKCFPCMAPGYNQTLCGPPVEYCNKTAWYCHAEKQAFAAHIHDWAYVPPNEDGIKAALYSQGPLSVLLDATALQWYHSGVWHGRFCSKGALDHAVLLVGWGVDKSVLGKEVPYWLVKNSWSEKWGEKGYFRILRGEGTCGINTAVVTALV